MMGGWGWHWGMGGLGFLLGFAMLVFWAVIIGLAVWLVVKLLRSASNRPAAAASTQLPPSPPVPQPDPVLETLRRRLAEGQITSQEFDELRQKLGV
jgi:uncharacterized membrane protein